MILRNDLLVIISFSAFLVGVICALILFSFTKKRRFSNNVLAFGLLGLAMIIVANTLTYTDIYFRVPHLFRSIFFVHYLIPPLFYIYVRSMANGETGFRKYDWIFFVPATLHFMEMTPFYLTGAEEKLDLIRSLFRSPTDLFAHREGMLPPFTHPFLKTFLGLIYTYFSITILLGVRNNFENGTMTKKMGIWLWGLVIQLGTFYLLAFIIFCFPHYFSNFIIVVDVLIMGVLLSTALTLMFHPSVLYGMGLDIQKQQDKNGNTFSLSNEQMICYEQTITSFFKDERPFLNCDYKINKLSEDIGVPVHHISYFINYTYGLSYSNFINRARIDHIISIYQDEKYRQLTLEGIAKEAGFNSRNTFIRAFKKYIGVTPSDYFLGQVENNDSSNP